MPLKAPDSHKVRSSTDYLISWSDLKSDFLACIDHKRTPKNPTGNSNIRAWESPSAKNWYGASLSDMRNWLRDGFHSPLFQSSGEFHQTRKRRTLKFGEEGELDFTLAYSGHDYPFQDWEMRERKPGLRIIIDLCFACMTRAEDIAVYAAWAASTIGTLEAAGYDLEVDVVYPFYRLYEGEDGTPTSGDRSNIIVRVKEANVASDFTEWSALFSPAGFRMLGFHAASLAGDRAGKTLTSTIGYPSDNGWRVEFDSDDRTLYCFTPNNGGNPPVDRLTDDLKDQGVL